MPRLVGIHRDPDHEFNGELHRYERILDHNKIEHVKLSVDDLDFWEQVSKLCLFIYCWRHDDRSRHAAQAILPVVEHEIGIPTYPNTKTSWHYDDKIRQWYLLKSHGFPMIRSWVFWGRDQALAWAKDAPLPVVFKLKRGAGSTNVLKLDTRKAVVRMINLMFGPGVAAEGLPKSLNKGAWKMFLRWCAVHKRMWQGKPAPYTMRKPNWEVHRNYILFQEYLPGNNCDMRITVIGNRAFGFRRMNRPGDFRASGSGLIDYDIAGIDPRCVEIAFDISRKMGFQSMAYDFLKAPNGKWQIAEISYLYLDTAIWRCSGYWDDNLKWVQGHYWPQYCQLVDALRMPELKQPGMDPGD
ncbi:MAG: hypothetical protein FJ117_22965 [Deltaproteobacteria bacterium]|nr:hypothetical protein [Deltaproteobacteria bacterium]